MTVVEIFEACPPDVTPLWATCQHGGQHVIDLSMSGAFVIIISAAIGALLALAFTRRGKISGRND